MSGAISHSDAQQGTQLVGGEWVALPGGELEARRPRALCPACRATLQRRVATASGPAAGARRGTICFLCYRAELERHRALRAAGTINTASEARFQALLPFEPVNRGRLEQLRVERLASQEVERAGAGRYAHRARQAQMAARRELHRICAGVDRAGQARTERARMVAAAIHAAELQLPDSWLSFVVSGGA